MKRIYLSPPAMCGRELEFVSDAFETNWIAPYGPHVDAFEREFANLLSGLNDEPGTRDVERGRLTGPLFATALSSGTAALHLALRILTGDRGQGTGSGGRQTNRSRSAEVICSTFTFAASANPIAYEGAEPVFIDSDAESWNMDPGLLREELADCAKNGRLPRAVIVVDLYGQCADYDPIVAICREFDVPLIEDAAEALGATYWRHREVKVKAQAEKKSDPDSTLTSTSTLARSAGSFGAAAALSFNGNKIITSAGGGCWYLTIRQSPTKPGFSPLRRAMSHRTISIPKSASTTG